MIACTPIDSAPASGARDTVKIGAACYQAVPPEKARISVAPGAYVAIPLYDGTLIRPAASKPVLRYVGVASVPELRRIHTAAGDAASHRLALFRVIGAPGDGATVQVRLRLPALRERCTSCRTVHFFINVR